MLGDTDRQRSTDLQQVDNPAFTRRPADDGEPAEPMAEPAEQQQPRPAPRTPNGILAESEQMVVSEHLFADFDRQLSQGDNRRPTLLYWVCLVGFMPAGLLWPFGGIFWPSFSAAFEHDDVLMAYMSLAFSVIWVVITPLFVQECRAAFRSDAEGPLVLLGAGKQLISEAQDRALRRHNWLFNGPSHPDPECRGNIFSRKQNPLNKNH